MKPNDYKFEDFHDFINSKDPQTVLLGLKMMKSSLLIKFMNYDELNILDSKLRKHRFKVFYLKSYELLGEVLCKINNAKQRLDKIERLKNGNQMV